MQWISAGLLAMLAQVSVSTSRGLSRQPTCASLPASFYIYANTTGRYAVHGSPCDADCYVFFDQPQPASSFSLSPQGYLYLTVNASNLAATKHFAFTGEGRSGQVRLGTYHYINENKNTTGDKPMRCGLQDSPDGDGSCDLICSWTYNHYRHTNNQSILNGDDGEWFWGVTAGYSVPFPPKVAF